MPETIPVTADNFTRAESDLYFGNSVREGGFGKFHHFRAPAPIDNQTTVIRMNRDTLYSSAVFDLDAGPVTVIMPEAGKRFMSMQVFDEDQYTHSVSYGAGVHKLTREDMGTRYVMVGIRTLVDPGNPEDVKQVNALQDAIKVEQKGGPGRFETPAWDKASQDKVRGAADARFDAAGPSRRFWPARKSRSRAPPHRCGCGLGRQSGDAGRLHQRLPQAE
jgi:hypothetical protein